MTAAQLEALVKATQPKALPTGDAASLRMLASLPLVA